MRPSRGDLYRDSYTGRPARGLWRGLLQVALVLGLVFAIFGVGDYLQRLSTYRSALEVGRGYQPSLEEVSYLEPLRSIALNSLAYLPRPWAERGLLESGLPVYDLRIASDELAELQEIAERVTAQRVSTGIERPYVPAELLMDGRWEPIKVKLRGLYSAHYIKTRPSLRLKFPSRKLMRGAKQVNLLDPYDKGLTVDVTTGWELAQHGLMTWDSRFVVLRQNGDVVGLFQEIEQFGRSLSDRRGRPEGPIFSGYGQAFTKPEGAVYEKAAAPLMRIQSCLGDVDLRVEGIARLAPGTEEPCDWDFFREYFDTGKWAWAAAASQLLHSAHAWHPDNVRMFWDPARGSFEPIPWDYGYAKIDLAAAPEGEAHLEGYARLMLSAPEFRRMRDTRAWLLLQERVDPMIDYAQGLFDSLAPALRLDARHPVFSLDEQRQAEYVDTLRQNRDALVALYEMRDLRGGQYTLADGEVVVALHNHAKSFALVEGATIEGASGTRELRLPEPVVVDGLWQTEPGSSQLRLRLEPGERVTALLARNGVTRSAFVPSEARLKAATGRAPEAPTHAAAEGLELSIEGVRIAEDRVHFGPGRVALAETIELPASFEVVIEPGTDLHLGSGVALMIHGDLRALGTETQPIRISGEPSWGGVFVQGTRLRKSRVTLRHTHVIGGVGGENARSFFTSSFAVHDGLVEIVDSSFEQSRADDGMNLKYASVELAGNLVLGSRDDALDCDFCDGELRDNEIRDSGGDGFDFSGSRVIVRDSRVERCADKGMSIGERTVARLLNNEVIDCYTGVAVKDLSEVEIRGLTLSQLQVGIAAYIKKPTFGPSRVRVADLRMSDVETRILRDSSCSVEEEHPIAVERGSGPSQHAVSR